MPAHSPGKDEAANGGANSQVEDTVRTLRVGDQHVGQVVSGDEIAESGRTSSNNGLGVNRRRVLWDQRHHAVGKDGVRKAQEHRATKALAEHDQSHGDRNLRWCEGVLDGEDGLVWTVSRTSEGRK